MAALVNLADVKTVLEATTTATDAWLTEAITLVSDRFQAEIRQPNLLTDTYTDELHDGNGLAFMYTKFHPVTALTSVTVNDVAITPIDVDHVRWRQSGRIQIVTGALFSLPAASRIDNVKLTYDAGHADIAAFEVACGDAHAMLIEAVKNWYEGDGVGKADRRGVSSMGVLGESVTYMSPIVLSAKRFFERRWAPMVNKYMRRQHAHIS